MTINKSQLHRRINDGLMVIVLLLGLYIMLSPFIPEITWRAKRLTDNTGGVPYVGKLSEDTKGKQPIPADNRIVIPKINLNETILEGPDLNVINNGGIWRRPVSSDDPAVSNMVVVGHRIYGKASNASTLYHIDKIKTGEKIAVYWQGKEYIYSVKKIEIVEATQISIEDPTILPTLTIYSCHPLWTAKDRMVVTAELEVK
jgi:LPXTG-site transpeptidase (sortase) family protein